MCDDNDVVHFVVPTEMAAFNILGETLHMFTGLDWKNLKKEMTKRTQVTYQKGLFIYMPRNTSAKNAYYEEI
jgi:hypothetical protein